MNLSSIGWTRYADLGWSIFPVASRSKKPLVQWKVYQSEKASREIITAWSRDFSKENLAVATGQLSGIFIVDVDKISSEDDAATPQERQRIREAHELVNRLRSTHTARTKTAKGAHFYFLYPVRAVPTKAGFLPGVDLRGDGGYALLPPSIHPNGTRYAWDTPPEDGIAAAPQWLLDAIEDNRSSALPREAHSDDPSWRTALNGAAEGCRNDAAVKLVGKMLASTPIELWHLQWEALRKWNAGSNRPPLDETELRAIFESIEKKELTKRNTGRLRDKVPPLVTAFDLSQESDDNFDFILDGLIARGGITLLTSKPKVGKTVFAANLAIAVARGESFIGRKTKRGCVIYLALEGYGQRRQLREIMTGLSVRTGDDVLFYAAQSPQDAENWLRETAAQHKPILIIFDTLGRLLRTKDLNDYAQVIGKTDGLLQIAQESTAAQLWLHHERKSGGSDGDESLGSTAILGSVDVQLSLRKEADGTRTIRSTDSRLGEPLEPTLVVFDRTTMGVTLGRSKQEAQRAALARRVRAIILERGTPTVDEIVDTAEARRADVLSVLVEGEKDKRFCVTGSGRRGDPKRYAVVDLTPDSVPNPIAGTPERNATTEQESTTRYETIHSDPNSGANFVPEENQEAAKAGNEIMPPNSPARGTVCDYDKTTLSVLRAMGMAA